MPLIHNIIYSERVRFINEIIVSNVMKKYSNKTVLNDISFNTNNGVLGLIGKNGAGKTTLIRILTGILKKSSGSVSINKINIENTDEVRKIIGYLPQEFTFYPYFKVSEILEYCGALSQMNRNIVKSRIDEILEKLNLNNERNVRYSKLSGGMKRRLGIAQAILHDPQILIIDEPTVGLDPDERYNLRKMIEKLGEDKIVIFSTHILEDIEHICKNIGVLHKGELKYFGSISDFKNKMNTDNFEKAYLNDIKG